MYLLLLYMAAALGGWRVCRRAGYIRSTRRRCGDSLALLYFQIRAPRSRAPTAGRARRCLAGVGTARAPSRTRAASVARRDRRTRRAAVTTS